MSEVSYKARLRENVFSSSWKEELKASSEIRTAILEYIDQLSENQAKALLDLDDYRPTKVVETKNVPQFVISKDPEDVQRVPSEDLGTITYETPPIKIADLLVMVTASRRGRDFLRNAASDPEDQIYSYWQQIAEILPIGKATRPDNYPLITTALAQKYRSLPQKETRRFVFEASQEVPHGKGKKLLITPVTAEYTGEGKITLQPIDLSIVSAVSGLLEAGNMVITPAMVWRWMAGLPESAKVTRHQEKIVTEAIERMRLTKMTIDATAEAQRYRKDAKTATIDQNILMLTGAKMVSVNGKKARGWEPVFNKRGSVILPILYVHAQISGQIQSVNSEDLRIEDLSMTEKNIVLRDVVLTNLHRITSRKATSNRISYSQIYKAAKIDETSKTARVEKQRVRETVGKILQDLKKKGRFYDFKEYGRSKTAKDGVEILSPPALEEHSQEEKRLERA